MKSSLSSGRRSVNPRLTIQPEKLAAAFIEQNPSYRLPVGEILSNYRPGFYSEAKRIWTDHVSSSALQERDHTIARQFGALLFKANLPGQDLERSALSKFLSKERELAEVNQKLSADRTLPTVDMWTRERLLAARSIVYSILPPLTPGVIRRIILLARPGPGIARGSANPYRTAVPWKYGATAPCVTDGAREYARWLIASSALWRKALIDGHYSLEPSALRSNKVAFVPKDLTSLRTIAVEPALNVQLQLGVHEYLTPILRSIGCDITDQTRNQELARLGSVDGSLFTMDLSAASDSISRALVHQLLPPDWGTFLHALRCSHGVLPDGSEIEYEKFSSMGNGATFALETLVFYALTRAVAPTGTVSVYGDDIIAPTPYYHDLERLLSEVGLSVNSDKSFVEGPFRESCGADWYNGRLVTPTYWRCESRPLVTECYAFLNQLPYDRFSFGKLREYVLGEIRRKTKITFGLSTSPVDSCLHAPLDYLRGIGAVKWSKRYQTYNHAVIRFRPSNDRADRTPNLALCALASGCKVSELPLRRVGVYRLGYALDSRD